MGTDNITSGCEDTSAASEIPLAVTVAVLRGVRRTASARGPQ